MSAARSKKYRDKRRADSEVARGEAAAARQAKKAAATGMERLRMMLEDSNTRTKKLIFAKRQDGPVGMMTSDDDEGD
jgi:hypothetical protein